MLPMSCQVKNLVLVVLWREVEGEKLRRLVIHNVCTDKATQSCDTYYNADVMDFHMTVVGENGTGLLSRERFNNIIFVGDHGPHFSGAETVYNESCMFEKYQVCTYLTSLYPSVAHCFGLILFCFFTVGSCAVPVPLFLPCLWTG